MIGGGASGMAASIASAESGQKTLLVEKSERLGKKVSASGNGRCNIMNTGKQRYYGNASFAEMVLRNCTASDLFRFFRQYGLLLKKEADGRVYPVTKGSISVLNVLKRAMEINKVDILLRTIISEIRKAEAGFLCITDEGDEFFSPKLIICTGGAAQRKLGGSSDGYRYLQSMGHSFEPVFPSLVPVITDQKSISGLSGIRVHGIVSLMDADKRIHCEEGEILFTDYGLSGICIMMCSRFISKPGLHFEIDFFSSIFENKSDALLELQYRRTALGSLSSDTLLDGILLPKLSFAVEKQAGIRLRGETINTISDQKLEDIVSTAYQYRVDVLGRGTLEEAQVTAGGILSSEFSSETMESKLVKGLHAAGEVLNVDGDCGGFNLMFAFATGLIAGGFRKNEKSFGSGE